MFQTELYKGKKWDTSDGEGEVQREGLGSPSYFQIFK